MGHYSRWTTYVDVAFAFYVQGPTPHIGTR